MIDCNEETCRPSNISHREEIYERIHTPKSLGESDTVMFVIVEGPQIASMPLTISGGSNLA